MERHVIVGTAGHIDHGKTALVKALTGVDTDRLAEEKRRGITIDLGFAPLDLGDVAASVVDVPGHEGFIKNMVAGATGVDLALLVVAADEGVMPQTAEHLAILRFLGVAKGVVALTKCDLSPDAGWRELVADEIQQVVERHFGERWPLVEVSATHGTGLGLLREALRAVAAGVTARSALGRFRMPVDRVFALAGAGTIVTGTVWSGTVREGDRVLVLPAGVEARVRSVEVHGRRAAAAEPARRAALALVGLSREQAARGSVVVTGDGWATSRALDVELTFLPGVVAALKPRARVRVHHGTSEVMARVVVTPAEAGAERVPARLRLEEPLVARARDRLVLRSYSPVTTIGGGRIVDPRPLARTRGRAGRAGRAASPVAAPATDAEWVALLIARRGTAGLASADLEVIVGLDAAELDAVLPDVARHGMVALDGWYVAETEVGALATKLVTSLARYHAEHPLEPGMPAQAWRASPGAAPQPLADLAEQRTLREGLVVREGSLVRLPDWAPGRDAAATSGREEVLRALAAAGAEPPSVAELSAMLPETDVPAMLRLLAGTGAVVAVAKDRYYEAQALEMERQRLIAVLEELGSVTPAIVRERLGRTRKWVIPLLEWCDRQGLTVRRGDERVLAKTRSA